MTHTPIKMMMCGRDYVTQRLNGKRCHHKLIYACAECGSEKRYFLNLMPKRKFPVCDGETQKLIQ